MYNGIINQTSHAQEKKNASEEKEAIEWAAAQMVGNANNLTGQIADKQTEEEITNEKNDFEAQILLKTTNYKEILSYMSNNLVNVVVLDIEFKNSQLNELDIANEIRKINKDCYIIFITSHFEYLMKAYDYKTFAYLFKNAINVETLSTTLNRLFEDISGNYRKFLK